MRAATRLMSMRRLKERQIEHLVWMRSLKRQFETSENLRVVVLLAATDENDDEVRVEISRFKGGRMASWVSSDRDE